MAQHPPGNLPPFQEQEDPATLPISPDVFALLGFHHGFHIGTPIVWRAWNRPLGVP